MPEKINNGGKKDIPPLERTTVFFHQEVRTLADALHNKVTALPGTNKKIKLDQVSAYPKYPQKGEEEIGKNYKKGKEEVTVDNLLPAILWAFHLSLRRINQSLVSARDKGKPCACVRLIKASRYDETTGLFVPMPREGDIADYLELSSNDTVSLQFLNESETLYIGKPEKRTIQTETQSNIDSTHANTYIDNLLQE
jgi:hypothetical protein